MVVRRKYFSFLSDDSAWRVYIKGGKEEWYSRAHPHDGDIFEDQKVRNMVGGLIQFAKSIDVQTIAEFVSSKEIYDEVKGLGVDYIQGYYFGEPKPAKEYGLV